MDWSLIFKEYPALVTAISALLGIILGFFFGRWNAEQKRKWELEDREFERRAAIHDMRIKEVRDYLNQYYEIGRMLTQIESSVSLLQDNGDINFQENFEELEKMHNLAVKSWASVYLLEDVELARLNDEFTAHFNKELQDIAQIINNYKKNQEIDTKALTERMTAFYKKSVELNSLMQYRLDKLAKTIK